MQWTGCPRQPASAQILETPRQLHLIMEFASGGELFDYIVEQQRLPEHEACGVLRQLVSGVRGSFSFELKG